MLVVALGWLVGLGMLVMRRDDGSHAARPHGPADGWSMIGLRHAGRDGGGGTVLLRAGELSLRRVRVGPFRLGFARELVARDVDIDVDVRPGDAPRRLTSATAPRWPGGGASGAVTSVAIERLHVRARGDGATFEVTAREAEMRWTDGSRVRLRGPVRVRGEDLHVSLPELAFDAHAGRFVPASSADVVSVGLVNEAMARVGDTVGPRLARLTTRLAAGADRGRSAAGITPARRAYHPD